MRKTPAYLAGIELDPVPEEDLYREYPAQERAHAIYPASSVISEKDTGSSVLMLSHCVDITEIKVVRFPFLKPIPVDLQYIIETGLAFSHLSRKSAAKATVLQACEIHSLK